MLPFGRVVRRTLRALFKARARDLGILLREHQVRSPTHLGVIYTTTFPAVIIASDVALIIQSIIKKLICFSDIYTYRSIEVIDLLASITYKSFPQQKGLKTSS